MRLKRILPRPSKGAGICLRDLIKYKLTVEDQQRPK